MRQETGPGMVLNPLMVAPAVSVRISPQAGITPLGCQIVRAFRAGSHRTRNRRQGNRASGIARRLALRTGHGAVCIGAGRRGAERRFQVFPDRAAGKTLHRDGRGGIRRPASIAKDSPRSAIPACAPTISTRPPAYRTSGVDVKVAPGLRVGYVTGTGDDVPAIARKYRRQGGVLKPAGSGAGRLCRSTT